MTCSEAQQLISRALDGDLGGEQASFTAHLAECPQCAAALAQMKALKSTLRRRLGGSAPPPSLWDRIDQRLNKVAPPVTTSRISGRLAAMIIAMATVVVGITWSHNRPWPEPVAITDEGLRQAWEVHHTVGPGCGPCQLRLVTDLNTATDWLSEEIGYRIPPWDFRPAGLPLTTVMVCGCLGRKAPVFRYEKDGRSVWVYVLPSQDFIFDCAAAMSCHSPQIGELGEFRVAGLLADRYLLCALSTLPTPEVERFAAGLPKQVERFR